MTVQTQESTRRRRAGDLAGVPRLRADQGQADPARHPAGRTDQRRRTGRRARRGSNPGAGGAEAIGDRSPGRPYSRRGHVRHRRRRHRARRHLRYPTASRAPRGTPSSGERDAGSSARRLRQTAAGSGSSRWSPAIATTFIHEDMAVHQLIYRATGNAHLRGRSGSLRQSRHADLVPGHRPASRPRRAHPRAFAAARNDRGRRGRRGRPQLTLEHVTEFRTGHPTSALNNSIGAPRGHW